MVATGIQISPIWRVQAMICTESASTQNGSVRLAVDPSRSGDAEDHELAGGQPPDVPSGGRLEARARQSAIG
jgi:hypothetical protein